MSLIKKLLMIKDKQPVTEETIKQLDLDARAAELKARISKAKAEGPSIFDSISKIIGKSNNNPFEISTPKRSDYDPFRW